MDLLFRGRNTRYLHHEYVQDMHHTPLVSDISRSERTVLNRQIVRCCRHKTTFSDPNYNKLGVLVTIR